MKSTERFVGAWVAAALCALILAAAPVGTARADYDDENTSEDIWKSCKNFAMSQTSATAVCNYENPNGSKTAATRNTNINLNTYMQWNASTASLSWGSNGYADHCYNSSLSVATDHVKYSGSCNTGSGYVSVSFKISDKIENSDGYLKYNPNM